MAFDPLYFDPNHFETTIAATWQYFEPDRIKDTIVSFLRDYVKPMQTSTSYTLGMYSTADVQVAQSFYPFSTQINSISIYLDTIGTPTATIAVHLTEDSNDEPSSTLSSVTITPSDVGSGGWIDKIFSKSSLQSKDKHWLKIVPSGQSSINYYSVRYSTTDDGYYVGTTKVNDSDTWLDYDADIAFKIFPNEFIRRRFPRNTIDLDNYPVIVVDVLSRPRVYERWVDKKIIEYLITINIILFSRYPREMDRLTRFTDRTMFKYRDSITPFRIVTPGRITPVTKFNEYVWTRGINYTGRMYVYR